MSDVVPASYAPIRVVRPRELSGATAQTAGMNRAEAISGRTVGAQRLWMGRTVAPAGKVSGVHHHGESETALYVLRGSAFLFFGDGLRERVEVRAGDFAFIPAWAIHAEGNLGAEDAEAIVVRSSQEAIVVNLPELRVPAEALAAVPTAYAMSTSALVRLSGLALMAALPASVLGELLHPPAHGLAQQLTPGWTPAHLLLALQALLTLLGLPLLYARQARQTGVPGLVAFVVLFVGLALSGVTAVYDAFVMPLLAQDPATAPLVDAAGRLANGPLAAGVDNAALRSLVTTLPAGLGLLLFAGVTLAGGVYSRWVGLLPLLGAVFAVLRYAVPQGWYNAARESGALPVGFGSIGAIAAALGFAVAGYALWKVRASAHPLNAAPES